LFGAFHLIATDSLAVERFLPSTFMGLALGWLCCRTGSVWPGIALHATHNSFLVCVAYYKDLLASQGVGVEEQSHLPAAWLLAAAVGAGLGVTFVMLASRRPAVAA
jgi:sodium transport system permease protein